MGSLCVPDKRSCFGIRSTSIVLVVNLPDLRLYPGFLGIVIRLPVFPVVIVSIWANIQPTQQPAEPKIFLMFFDKPISL